MKIAVYSVLAVMILIVPTVATAQQWKLIPPVIAGFHASTYEGDNSNASVRVNLSANTSGEFKVMCGRVVISGDKQGMQWSALPFHPLWTVSGHLKLGVSIGKLYAFWSDKSRTGEDRLARYLPEEKEWKFITPVEFRDISSVGIVDSMLIVRFFDRDTTYISADYGDTWKLSNNKRIQADATDRRFTEPSAGIVAFRSGIADSLVTWLELRSGSSELIEVRLPRYTQTYCYLDSNNIICGISRKGYSDASTKIGISLNNGTTWKFLDSLTFVNSSLVLGGGNDRGNFTVTHAQKNVLNHVTLWFESAHIATTTDGGKTWWDRTVGLPLTRFSRLQPYDKGHITHHADGSYSLPYIGKLGFLSAEVFTPLEIRGNSLSIRSLAYDNGVYVAGTGYGLMRSSDDGATWLQTGVVPELINSSKSVYYGQRPVVIDQIYPVDSLNVDGVCTYTSAIVKWNPQYATWQTTTAININDGAYVSPNPFLSSEAYYDNSSICSHQQGVVEVTPGTTLYNHGLDILRYSNSSDSSEVISPSGTDIVWASISSYIMLDSSTHFATRDSLYISRNAGATWIIGGKGLPRNKEGNLVSCSGIVKLSSGDLLAGFRGSYVQTDTGEIALYNGGFYLSTDAGVTWTKRKDGLDANLCVWFMHRLPSSDTVLATVGKIIRFPSAGQPRRPYSMSDGRLIRSTNGGKTWQDVYLETRSRPGFTGRREIISHPDGRVLVATMEDGVIESFDAGATWRTLGGQDLLGAFINDLAIDTMGLVYASTSDGVYYFVPAATGVDEPFEPTRVTTVYAYPTPTVGQLRVRVNNLNLAGVWSSLRLYNLYGGVEVDLSTLLRQTISTQPSAQRHEFDFSTIGLQSGVFLLVLETEKGSNTMKVLVSN
ncbi:MAG: hypothetical protein HQ472_06310 [Ignavibacteria bacterium]|nr:hypothetical protein [Ignavibacteria bacterium]